MFRKATRAVIDSWLVAHSVSQPPTVAGALAHGGVTGVLVTAIGNIATTVIRPRDDQSQVNDAEKLKIGTRTNLGLPFIYL